ncbi:LysR family transcriptional regulator, partial [Escherichia coli]
LTTYLLRLDAEPSETLARFIQRVQAIDSPEAAKPTPGDEPDVPEESEP